jgi:hypothetical protein
MKLFQMQTNKKHALKIIYHLASNLFHLGTCENHKNHTNTTRPQKKCEQFRIFEICKIVDLLQLNDVKVASRPHHLLCLKQCQTIQQFSKVFL